MRQERHHEVGRDNRDETVDYSGAKVEQAQRQSGHDEVEVVMQLRQREYELAVEDGSGKSCKTDRQSRTSGVSLMCILFSTRGLLSIITHLGTRR